MNLLKDKREQERSREPQEFPSTPLQEFGSDSMVTTPFPENKERKHFPWFPLLGILTILVASAAVYYFGFYKNTHEVKPTAPQEQVVVTEIPTTEVKTEEIVEQQTPREAPVAEQVVAPQKDDLLAKTAHIFTCLEKSLNSGSQLGTVILDNESFSAELSADSQTLLQSMVDTLRGMLTASVTFPADLKVNSTSVLIHGSFPAPAASTDGTQLSSSELEIRLRELAAAAGLTVMSISLTEQTPKQMFVKVSGSLTAGRIFIESFSTANINSRVSRIILMNGPQTNYTLVLRFII